MANKIISFVLKTSKQQSDQVSCISPLDTYISRALWFVPWMTATIRSSFSLVIWSANIKVEKVSIIHPENGKRQQPETCHQGITVPLAGSHIKMGWWDQPRGGFSRVTSGCTQVMHRAAQRWTTKGRMIFLNWFQKHQFLLSGIWRVSVDGSF